MINLIMKRAEKEGLESPEIEKTLDLRRWSGLHPGK